MSVETNDCRDDKVDWKEDREHNDHPWQDEFGPDAIGDEKRCYETNCTASSSLLALVILVKAVKQPQHFSRRAAWLSQGRLTYLITKSQ
jgi:hypothetical protein